MFRSMKLGTKIMAGFIAVSMITLALGIIGYLGAVSTRGSVYEIGSIRLPSVESLLVLSEAQTAIDSAENALLSRDLGLKGREEKYTTFAEAWRRAERAWAVFEPLPQTEEEARLWKEFVPAWEAWKRDHDAYVRLSKEYDSMIQTYSKQAGSESIAYGDTLARAVALVKDARILLGTQIQEWKNILLRGWDEALYNRYLAAFEKAETDIQETLFRCRELIGQMGFDTSYVQKLLNEHATLGTKYRDALKDFDKTNALDGQRVDRAVRGADRPISEAMEQVILAAQKAEEAFNDIIGRMNHQALVVNANSFSKAEELLLKMVDINAKVAEQASLRADSQAVFIQAFTLAALVVGVILAILLGIFITRSITKPINRIIEGLNNGAEQVSSASTQVSSASQSLAEGASEQAAAIEETSSSLEEMSSMTKQNAENANQARTKMAEAGEIVSKVNRHMDDMAAAIKEITKSSEETGKIIKTIDEIAFQTNLLALNAAVEAARAGEAGAGFAVVADEVRNLAMRAADAAKNTADLIEKTIKSVKTGNDLTESTQEAYKQNVEISAKVGELVDEIAAASEEQAQGIDQINKAVTEMDKVTQQNAANAEESASASEEMNAQADEMQAMVHELVTMVGGSSAGTEAVTHAQPKRMAHHAPAKAPARTKALTTSRAQAPAVAKREVRPEQVIPFKDEELKKF